MQTCTMFCRQRYYLFSLFFADPRYSCIPAQILHTNPFERIFLSQQAIRLKKRASPEVLNN